MDAGRYDAFELPDGQDFASCLDRIRQLTPEVVEWVGRGPEYQVVVDFTGGTKCMSASIGLQASRWPCVFSYVGGGDRTKAGVGVVVSGFEKVVYQANPWDALGHQAVEDFVVLFDRYAFVAAARIAAVARARVSRPDRKREFAALEQLANALDAWDRFDHESSSTALNSIGKAANDLRSLLGSNKADHVLVHVARLSSHVEELCSSVPPSRHHVFDLLANARRRWEEGRVDDAVARLYRAIEAIAQVALKQRHGIENTERVPLERVPESIRPAWADRAKDGVVALALQDAYVLLAGLNDPLGDKFRSAALTGIKSPLAARNRSILAHGFERVSEGIFDKLWTTALYLSEIEEASLPSFPALGERAKHV